MQTVFVLKHDHLPVDLRHKQPSAWAGVGIARKWQAPCLDEKPEVKG